MMDGAYTNPYHSGRSEDDITLAPFAGRKLPLARLHQALTDPIQRSALLFLGARRMGKTALLRVFERTADEGFVTVYIPLRETPIADETDWVLALAQAITAQMIEQGISVSRLSNMEAPGENGRDWLKQRFLPEVFAAIRPQRQIVLLLDDAERLVGAVKSGRMRPDIFADMADMLGPQLGIALTMDWEFEADVREFAALISSANVIRMSGLADDECLWLLQEPPRGAYSVTDECVAAVVRATGGAPNLVQHYGYQLFERWLAYPGLNVVTLDDVKAATPLAYSYTAGDFADLWQQLAADERLVLSSISRMVYDDPLARVDAGSLERWMLETDYPLDATVINAAVRGLEYRDILKAGPTGISIAAGLLQSWLLENGALGGRLKVGPLAGDESLARPSRMRLIVILVLLLAAAIVVAALLISATQTPQQAVVPLRPTVTLLGTPLAP